MELHPKDYSNSITTPQWFASVFPEVDMSGVDPAEYLHRFYGFVIDHASGVVYYIRPISTPPYYQEDCVTRQKQ